MTKRKLYIFLVLLSVQFGFAQYISVDESYTAEELVEDVLFSNSCASVSNVSVSGGDFGTGEKSWGYFNAAGTSFDFEDGIILSTGKARNGIGPNTFLSDDDGINWGGDNDLNQALNISNSLNATILEFDFVPLGNKISFDYIFSSEEYHDTAPCQYSDGFAFLLKEVGSSNYENLAVIPGTNIPVKVTTVHPIIMNGCDAENPEYFGSYNPTNHPTNYNGQTVILRAESDVTPGSTYHIKLIIADEGNYRYDSAIFLKGGSFSSVDSLGDNRTFQNNNPICYDENFTLDATTVGTTGYQWYFNDTLLVGKTNPILSFSPPYDSSMNGNYRVRLDFGTCSEWMEIQVDFTETLQINKAEFKKCDDDLAQNGISYFTATDLNTIKNQLFITLPSNYTLQLFENIGDTTPISIPFHNNTAYNQTIYGIITNISCYDPIPIDLIVNVFEDEIEDEFYSICSGSSVTLEADEGYDTVWSTGEINESSINVNTPGTYIVELIQTNECSYNKTFTVVTSEIAVIENIIIDDFSHNNSAQIIVSGNGDYEYSLDGINYQNSSIFTNLEEGEYTVFVNDKNGCGISSKNFLILDYPKFFTPNGDGYNDTWNIENLEKRGLQASKIFIFDRLGKLLKQMSPEGNGWNGTYNGVQLPSEDYWFILELTSGKTIKGHFTLKR